MKIPLDKESGKIRTFGFVTYQDACSVPYACELFNGLKLFGRPISCKPQQLNENSRNDHKSPSHWNSSSDDELASQRRFSDARRTPSLQFIGGDESPYGRTPDMKPNIPHPLLRRAVSGDSVLSMPKIRLRQQPLISQSIPNMMLNGVGLFETPGPIRRGRHPLESRQDYESHESRYRANPY